MKTIMKSCIRCGGNVTLVYVEKPGEEIPPIVSWLSEPTTADFTEVGWWHADCLNCGLYYSPEQVENWALGRIEAFTADLQSGDDVRGFLSTLLKQCPEAREIARRELNTSSNGYIPVQSLLPFVLGLLSNAVRSR